MKKVLLAISLLSVAFTSAQVGALELDRKKGHYTEVESVVAGFWSHVGVQLPSDTTCNGRSTLILLKTNPLYSEIYSLLLSASTSGKKVHFGPRFDNVHSTGFCIIQEAATDQFRGWDTQ